jgi:hypothetical protein
VTALPERPPISAPDRPLGRFAAGQPGLGVLGLLLVVPIAAALAFAAGGADGSVLVLGPLVTYGLPLVAMVAFWWEDWPGTRLRPSWSGWADTVLIAAGAVALTALGQIVVSGLDVRALFEPNPGPGHEPTFPALMPLGGCAFVAMLELTLVGEGWPLRRAPPIPAGAAALGVAWAVAVAAYFVFADVRRELGTVLVLIGAWQVLFYVAGRGLPFSLIARRGLRLTCAHAVVIGAGIVTYLVAKGIGDGRLIAIGGCFVAAVLLVGMLLEGWLAPLATVAASVALTAVLVVALDAVAAGLNFTRATPDEWVAHVGLNAIGVSTLLHVAIGRRWPLPDLQAGGTSPASARY